MTKWRPFHSGTSHQEPQGPSAAHVDVFSLFFFLSSSPPPDLLYTMDFGGRLSILFAVNFSPPSPGLFTMNLHFAADTLECEFLISCPFIYIWHRVI